MFKIIVFTYKHIKRIRRTHGTLVEHQTFDVKVFPNSNVQVTIKILLVYILLTTLLNNNAKPSRDLYGKV